MNDTRERLSSQWLFIAVVVLSTVALDQLTKVMAIKMLTYPVGDVRHPIPPLSYLGDMVRIIYAENTGAFLSLGSTLSPEARFWVLTVSNCIILGGVGLYMLMRPTPRLITLALALIFSGGVGNLIDRILRDGKVVDFMNLGITLGGWELRTGIFNVADLAIVGGLVLLMVSEFLMHRIQRAVSPAADAPSKPSDAP